MKFEPRQVLRVGPLWYEIEGVFLGAEKHTNLLGLLPLSQFPGSAHGRTQPEMFVPEALVVAAITGGSAALYGPIE